MDLADRTLAGVISLKAQLEEMTARAEAAEARADRAEAMLLRVQNAIGDIGTVSTLESVTPANDLAPELPVEPAPNLVRDEARKIIMARQEARRRTKPAKPKFGLGIVSTKPARRNTGKSLSLKPEKKALLLEAVANDPGKPWDDYRETLGLKPSPFFRKACRELEAAGLCTVRDNKVHSA